MRRYHIKDFDFDKAMLDLACKNIETEENRFKDIDTKAIGIITITGALMVFLGKPPAQPSASGNISYVFFALTGLSFLATIFLCILVIRTRSILLLSTKGLIKGHFFNWDEVPKKNSSFREFLSRKYGFTWAKTAKSDKSNDGNTINVFSKNNSLSLNLNNEQNKVCLMINDGLIKLDEFVAKHVHGRLCIHIEGLENKMSALQKKEIIDTLATVENELQRSCQDKIKDLTPAVYALGIGVFFLIIYSLLISFAFLS